MGLLLTLLVASCTGTGSNLYFEEASSEIDPQRQREQEERRQQRIANKQQRLREYSETARQNLAKLVRDEQSVRDNLAMGVVMPSNIMYMGLRDYTGFQPLPLLVTLIELGKQEQNNVIFMLQDIVRSIKKVSPDHAKGLISGWINLLHAAPTHLRNHDQEYLELIIDAGDMSSGLAAINLLADEAGIKRDNSEAESATINKLEELGTILGI